MSGAEEGSPVRGAAAEGSQPGWAGAALSGSRSQVIHSGHFMVSSPHSERRGCDFDTVNRRTCRTYRFGPRSRGRLSIDPSLSRLLECMTLAYSGKLVSPKWKTFKGLRLLWRDKIRLNNAIWRAWYTQYVEKRKNPVCGFITPLEGTEADEHRKPEAIVLEGNYWKRKIEVVIKEYHKWRIYFKKRLHKNKDDDLSSLAKEDIIAKSVEKWSSQILQDSVPMEEGDTILCDLEYLLSDISDTLFTMTQKTEQWPNAGEVVYTSNADIIQPELAPLQPNLDELMDMQGFFSSPHHPHPATSFPEHSHFSNMASNPFGAGSLTVPAETMLLDSQHPQADVLSDHGLRLGGAIPAAKISNELLHGSTVPSEIIDSRSTMFSGSRFQSPAYYEQGAGYLMPDSLTAQPSCIASYCSTMVSAPSATISEQEPSYCSVPPQNPKSIYGTNVCPSVSAHPAPTLFNQHVSALTIPPSMVLSPPPTRPLSSTTTSSDQLMAPLQQVPGFALPKVQSLRSMSRRKYKTVNPEVESSCMLPSAASSQNLDLIQLPSAGKQESGPLPQFSLSHDAVIPSSCPTSTLSDFPGTTFMKAPQHVLIKPPPQSSISFSVPFVFPKTERLSPSSSCNGKVPSPVNRGSSGQLSLSDSGELSSATQSPISTPSRTRPGTNKAENRRITHISAEQKRRFNIKLGFDTLHSLVTSLDSQPAVKVSKATTLQKTAEYIAKLQQERAQTQEEAQRIREDIERINAAINICQQQLPATGVPITRQRFRQMREMFNEYVRVRTLSNWKFWIFSIIIRPLFESFNGMVSTGSVDDLCQTALAWLEQHCSLPALRLTALNSLRQLSTSSSILSDPSLVPEQASLAVRSPSLS